MRSYIIFITVLMLVYMGFVGFFVKDLNVSSEADAVNRLIAVWESCNGGYGDFPDVSIDLRDNTFDFDCHRATNQPVYKDNKGDLTGKPFDATYDRDVDYVLKYLRQNFPTYDCPLVDENYGKNRPCWGLRNYIQFYPEYQMN